MNCEQLEADALELLFERFMPANEPVIVRGLHERHELELFELSLARLREQLGPREYPVMVSHDGYLSYEREFVSMNMAQFEQVTQDEGPGPRYYFKNSLAQLPPTLDDSARIPALAPYVARAQLSTLWVSGSGLQVGLHFDPAENLNLQLRGRKRFSLYPPGVRDYAPEPFYSEAAHISGVFRTSPILDAERFAAFARKQARVVELEAGDLLYLPAYWWHTVESLGACNINLNHWWLPRLGKQVRHWRQAGRGLTQLVLRRVRYGSIECTRHA